jgi:hypothetical protein
MSRFISLSDAEAAYEELESQLREQHRVLTGQRHWLKVAAEYKNDDPAKQLEGMQAALLKASEYQPRQEKRRRRP